MTRTLSCLTLITALLLPFWLCAQAGTAPKSLLDPASPSATKQIITTDGPDKQVSTSLDRDGLRIQMKAGSAAYPGVTIRPDNDKPWDLTPYGHIEVKVTNTGAAKLDLHVRIDNAGDYTKQPWNDESKSIDTGQTRTIRVYFGYSYGYRPGFKLDPAAITQVLLYTGKLNADVSCRIDRIQGAGWAGEKIGLDPDRVSVKPGNGVILDANTPIQPATRIVSFGGATASIADSGGPLQVSFTGARDQFVALRPAEGLWNLGDHVEAKVIVRNTGKTPIIPAARLESETGATEPAILKTALVPGAQAELVIPFAATTPWKGVVASAQLDASARGAWVTPQPGTGTGYCSNMTTGIVLSADQAGSLAISSILVDCPPLKLPNWLGKRPPVDGDWVQTLNEEFDGNALDPHRWNVHPEANYWDKRMHFSKDQILVGAGLLKLRLEKKPGRGNDDPKGALTDYAAGQPDTYGKWTQRYGYFEIREKQPTAKCCWPGLWLMPDRGLGYKGNRGETANGGMEFDITESQSSWGPHRFNIACHWDSYGTTAKSLGSSCNYVQADKDGFIVVGMLWTPGSVVFYGNGKEILRWESPRVSHQQEYLILQNEIGGWDNEEVDDSQLPADFIVDYIRVWQRKDLASPQDGPKPNKGGYDALHEELPATAP